MLESDDRVRHCNSLYSLRLGPALHDLYQQGSLNKASRAPLVCSKHALTLMPKSDILPEKLRMESRHQSTLGAV